MNFVDFYAGKNDNDRRLDKVLRAFISETSLSQIYKFIRKKLIRLNDQKAAPETHVFEGDKISIAEFIINVPNGEKSPNNTADLEIIFENQHILIINKPYDISVHGSDNSLDRHVLNYYKNSPWNTPSLSFSPGPLHRLDRKTTGILCFSMSIDGARWFSTNIQSHTIKKHYIGIIQGRLTQKEKWIDYISKEESDSQKQNSFHTVKAETDINYADETARQAITTVIPIKYGIFENSEITLVNFLIETGRTHQIRAQSSIHNHPLLGDTAYGGKKIISRDYCNRFFLHAQTLIFPSENPLSLPVEISAKLPDIFSDFISKNIKTDI